MRRDMLLAAASGRFSDRMAVFGAIDGLVAKSMVTTPAVVRRFLEERTQTLHALGEGCGGLVSICTCFEVPKLTERSLGANVGRVAP